MKKLLIVDNSTVIINVLIDLFNKEGNFKIFSVKSFQEAEELIRKHSFFASIANIVLPDALNGELLELLENNKIPTVVLTSKLDNNSIKLIKKANVTDYISKDSIYELETACKLINLLTFIDTEEVLVVDDSNVITSQVKNFLETLLLKVHIAKNGYSALEMLEKNPKISMIITDYNMDKMDGLEFITNVRKNPIHSSLPIIIMTTENTDKLKVKFFKNGATDFLTKPIIEEELKSKIINIYSNKKYIENINSFNEIFDEYIISSKTDSRGIIKYVSKAFCDISGFEREELIGQPHNIVRHPEMPSSIYKDLWKTIKSGNSWKGEIKNIRRDGTYYWVKVVIEPNFDKRGEIIGFTSVRQDITDRKRIYELSITDGLTSLYNRRYFNEIAHTMIDESSRNTDVLAFLLIDIDNFKKYNDTYGHQKGDNVLIEVSKSLKNSFKRNDDKVFRIGGEEFGVLMNAKTKDDVIKLAQKARKDIEELSIEHKKNPPKVITASFGLAIIINKILQLDDIYKLSDDLLYKAKENGRNRIEYTEI